MNQYRVVFENGKIYAGLATWRKDGWHWVSDPQEAEDDAFCAVMESMLDMYDRSGFADASYIRDDGRDIKLTLTVKNNALADKKA